MLIVTHADIIDKHTVLLFCSPETQSYISVRTIKSNYLNLQASVSAQFERQLNCMVVLQI